MNNSRGLAGLVCRLRHVADAGGDFVGHARCLSDVGCDFFRCCALFFNCGGNLAGNRTQAFNGLRNLGDGVHSKIRFLLDLGNLLVDFFGCLTGLVGQLLDFRSHHSKATARFSGRAASMVALRARRLVCSAMA